MRSFSSPSRMVSAASVRVPPLTSSKIDGEPYKRHDDVETEIRQVLEHPQAEWTGIAKRKGDGRLSSEAIVFLIRQIRNGDRNLCGELVYELSSRAARIAARWAQGFDQDTMDEIVWQVEKEIVDLVLAETPSRQSDFLEVAFGTAVERRTINAVEKRKHAPLPLRAASSDISDDKTELERYTELVADEYPGPEEIVVQFEDEARRPELIRKARAAVKDPRHLEAVILRHVRGWPITDKDPTKPTLARHFKKSERQIRNWINEALEAMRAEIGDQK